MRFGRSSSKTQRNVGSVAHFKRRALAFLSDLGRQTNRLADAALRRSTFLSLTRSR